MTVGATIRELRKTLGMSQSDLGKAVGLTQARISQLESQPDGSAIDKDVLVRLSRVLGTDVLEAVEAAKHRRPSWSQDASLVALWRLRADVLNQLGMEEGNRLRRRRLMDLSRSLIRATMRHPSGRRFSKDGELQGLERLARNLTDAERAMIVSEVGWMKLDAPVETGYSRSRARRILIDIARSQLHVDVTPEDFKSLRDRPYWQQLTCVGGPLGSIESLMCGDPDSVVLRGHDPVGWFGWPAVSGQWLVQTPTEYPVATLNQVAHVGADLTRTKLGLTKWTDTQLAAIAVQRVNEWEKGYSSALDVNPPLGASWMRDTQPGQADVRRASILLMAEALGRYWVKIETSKLVTAYRILAKISEPAVNEALVPPPLPEALSLLEEITNAPTAEAQSPNPNSLEALVIAEKEEGGTSRRDDNSVLGNRADILESFRACLKSLTKISPAQEGERS